MHRYTVTLVVLALLLVAACSSAGGSDAPSAAATPTKLDDPPRAYAAEWFIDAEAVDADGPGFPFVYREVVDDRTGRYLVQSPNHIAVQRPDEVVFCAAIFRSDPFCSAVERAEGAPHVLSYPIQLLREWGPEPLYDLASHREFELVVARDAEAWTRRFGSLLDGTPVECFSVTGETTAAATGFEVCFTNDDLHLVATVDLQGDLIHEIDLQSYETTVRDEDLETGLEDIVEDRPSLHEQLIGLYPEIPAPRPSPTPALDVEQG